MPDHARAEFPDRRLLNLLLKEDLTMSEIARMLGYSDPSNFGRAVRKWTGQSPKQLRVRRQGIPNRRS
jgi:AraC-like DNA-binding protein